jgi:methionyl-tRNA formyltransferase
MRIIILTQNENLYLPNSFAAVCKALNSNIVCIVSSPAMSTHGGTIKGFIKLFRLFGIKGTFIMGTRVMRTKLKAAFSHPNSEGSFYSIKQVAMAFKIPFYHVYRVKDHEFQDILDKHQPDLLVSISCPQVIGKKIRDKMSMGCINVHGAPLPKYRGLMPAFWTLRNGEIKTAVSVHDLKEKLDNGDIILQREIEILSEDTWDSLVRKTKEAGAQVLVDAVQQIKNGTVKRRSNPEEEATYFSFPTAEDRRAFIKAGRKFF